jgi:gas vesicle protein
MAQLEYEGIKMSGSKLLIIIPLLGTLIGGLWGGFEVYNRLLEAEEKLEQLQPESIQQEIARLTELTEVIKDNLAGDILEASRLARSVEVSSASTQREVRNDVYAMEKEMQSRFKEMDSDIREMRKELEERIQTILENPLNDVE